MKGSFTFDSETATDLGTSGMSELTKILEEFPIEFELEGSFQEKRMNEVQFEVSLTTEYEGPGGGNFFNVTPLGQENIMSNYFLNSSDFKGEIRAYQEASIGIELSGDTYIFFCQ